MSTSVFRVGQSARLRGDDLFYHAPGAVAYLVSRGFFQPTFSAVDPTTIPLTGLWLDGYSGSPWTGTASRNGSSGGRTLSNGAFPPSTATAVNGHVGASFNGSSNTLTDGGTFFASDVFSAYARYTAFVVQGRTAPTSVTGIDDPYFFGDANRNYGISYSADGFRAFQYSVEDGGWQYVTCPATNNAWHYVECWHDGSYLHLAVDGVEGTAVLCNPAWFNTNITGFDVHLGNYDVPGNYFDGIVLAAMFADYVPSPDTRDGLRSYMQTRYNVDLGFGVSSSTGTLTSTIAAVTAVGTGVVKVNGSATPALAAVTSSATGTVKVSASSTPTLGAITVVSAGIAAAQGTATPTLGAVTLASAGIAAVRATSTATLGAVTLSSSAQAIATAALNAALASVTTASAGTSKISGNAAATIGPVTSTATGTSKVTGAAAGVLDAILATAIASAPAHAIASGTLGNILLVSVGGTQIYVPVIPGTVRVIPTVSGSNVRGMPATTRISGTPSVAKIRS